MTPSPNKVETATGSGGLPPHSPAEPYGGDDGGSEDHRLLSYRERLQRCRLGLGLSIVSVTGLFLALSLAYLYRRHFSTTDADGRQVSTWLQVKLPPVLLLNTLLLLASSSTLELARKRLRERALLAPLAGIPGVRSENSASLPWLGITLVLGVGFLAGQVAAWQSLRVQGFYLAGNPSSAFFYILTGAHAIHLLVGIAALLYAAGASFFARTLELRCLIVDVTSWYWHFMAALWLGIYALLAFAQ